MLKLGLRTQPVHQSVMKSGRLHAARFNSSKTSQNNHFIKTAIKDFTSASNSNSNTNNSNTNSKSQNPLLTINFKGGAQKKLNFSGSTGSYQLDPREVAGRLRETGPRAGRVVRVFNNDLNQAWKNLRGLVTANGVKRDSLNQKFHMKPGKAREIKTIQRNKREFMNGFRRLMQTVQQAKRRGY